MKQQSLLALPFLPLHHKMYWFFAVITEVSFPTRNNFDCVLRNLKIPCTSIFSMFSDIERNS